MNFKFDLVIANIETDILIEILPDLKSLLKTDSTLILSGILLVLFTSILVIFHILII